MPSEYSLLDVIVLIMSVVTGDHDDQGALRGLPPGCDCADHDDQGALRVLPPGCDCDQGVFLVLLPGYGGDCGDRNDNGYCIV